MQELNLLDEKIDLMPPIEVGLHSEFQVQIPINPYRGFQEVLSAMPPCVALTGTCYIPSEISDPSGEGYVQFSFIAKAKGEGLLLFDHIKPWSPVFGNRTILEKHYVIVR
jgi:hypothetical protein